MFKIKKTEEKECEHKLKIIEKYKMSVGIELTLVCEKCGNKFKGVVFKENE